MFLLIANIFQPLIDIFEPALKFFHNLGLSWGWSIVALTIVIRALMLPLAFKQFHSMQKLQRVAPQLKELQKKYKDDKQRQQQEIMKFYKENDVNPFASCLPLALQLPVFIGLFYTLRTRLRKDICPGVQAQYELAHHSASAATACGAGHGANFLFIPDITSTATGATLVILIVLYVGTQLASSLMMSTPTMDKTQRQIMVLMPLFFVVFIIRFPAGLILYWITTNTWTMGQQFVIRRRLGPVIAATPATDGGGGGGGNGRGRDPGPGPNGSDSGGGLAGLLRGRSTPEKDKQKEPVAVGVRARRDAPPPPSPRKKKKRSGRRR